MPRRARIKDQTDDDKPPLAARPGHNGVNGQKLQGYIDEVEAEQAKIDAHSEGAKKKSLPHRERIKEIKKEAAEDGFSAKEFNAVIRKRRLEAKIDMIRERLDEPQQDVYDQLLHALGQLSDLPLGEAAMSRATDGSGHAAV